MFLYSAVRLLQNTIIDGMTVGYNANIHSLGQIAALYNYHGKSCMHVHYYTRINLIMLCASVASLD